MKPSEQFADWQVLRTIQLQRVSTWLLRDVIARLARLEKQILSALIVNELDGTESGPNQRRAFRQFKTDVDQLIIDAYRELNNRVELALDLVAEKDEEKQREIFATLLGITVAQKVIKGRSVNVMGATVKDWHGKQAGDLQFRIEQAIQNGLNAGEDAAKLRRRIKGWTGTGEQAEAISIPRVLTPSERAAEQVLRTAVEAVGQEVLTDIGERVPKSIRVGWQQISVLDARTTSICRSYAFKIWDRDYKPVGHKLPYNGGVPRHVNCRSRIVLYLFDDGPNSEFTFKQWMDRLTPEEQKQIFGANRVKLWREGKLKDQDLIRAQEFALNPEDLNK